MKDQHAPRILRRFLTGIFIGCLLMFLLTTTVVVLRATAKPHIFSNPPITQTDGPIIENPNIAPATGLVTVNFVTIVVDVVWGIGAVGSLLWLISSTKPKSQAEEATTGR